MGFLRNITPIPHTPPQPGTTIIQQLLAALPNCVHPIYVTQQESEFVLRIHCPASTGLWAMNEAVAIHLCMFFLGSLVRYRPDLLDELLGSPAAWLLESFVIYAPLLYLRIVTSLILNVQIINER